METPDGAEIEVKQEVQEVAPPVEDAQPKTYTQEELNTILADKEKEAENRVKGLNKVVSRKDKEIELIRSSSQENQSLRSLQRIARVLESTIDSGDFVNEGSAAKAKAELASINREIIQAQARTRDNGVKATREVMHSKITDAGYDINDPKFRQAKFYFGQGAFKEANEEVDEILAKLGESVDQTKTVVSDSKKESEDDIRARIKSEVDAELRQKYNLAKQDTAKNGGISADEQAVKDAFVKSPDNPEARAQYYELRKRKGW